MKKTSHLQRYDIFVAAGTLAAYSSSLKMGFRQKEVRFFTELFSNWMDLTLPSAILDLENTQIKRYIESLVELGFAKKKAKSRPPAYLLTRGGIIQLIEQLRYPKFWSHPAYLFFVYFFIKAYGPRIINLLEGGDTPLPNTFKLEIERLLDANTMKKEQINILERKLNDLENRVSESLNSSLFATQEIRLGVKKDELFKKIEKINPYQLSNQVPLSKLLNSLSTEQALWEVSQGGELRASLMWKPLHELLKSYLDLIRELN
jgi:hypothetical protein